MEDFSITYDEKDEVFLIKVRWAAGVQIAFPDRVVLADEPQSVAASESLATAVTRIAGCVCSEGGPNNN